MLILKSYVPLYSHGTWENKNTNAYPWVSRLPQMFFKTSCQSLSKIWNTLRPTCYLDDLLILTNTSNRFKDHLLKLERLLARLSTAGMRVNISKSKFFAEQIQYLGYWILDTGAPDKVFNLYITWLRWMQSLILRQTKQENNNKLRQLIGIVNYYRDMWFRRSVLLARFH
jgi:hypothetical protein